MMEPNILFTEVTDKQAATVCGGAVIVSFNLNTYLYIIGAAYAFGNPGVTPEEIQFAWESAFTFQETPTIESQNSLATPELSSNVFSFFPFF